jgi:hypothetical protein
MFGNRTTQFMGISGYSMTLPEFVAEQLSSGDGNKVNDNYSRKNIKFRF